MPLILRHMLRQLILATLALTGVLAAALWLTQSLRFLELAVEGKADPLLFLTLVGLTMPPLLAVILPVAALVVTLFIYNRMTGDNELIVLRGAGIGHWPLAAPALILAVLVMVSVFALNAWAAPLAKRELKSLLDLARSEFSDILLRPGMFNALGGNTTVFVQRRNAEGTLFGLMIHDRSNAEEPVTIFAERGELVLADRGTGAATLDPRVIVFNGTREAFDPETGRISRLEFAQYAIDVTLLKAEPARIAEADERTLSELVAVTEQEPVRDAAAVAALSDEERYTIAYRNQLVAEAHGRIATPLLTLSFVVIALVALLGGQFDRRGYGRRILVAIALVVMVQGASLGIAGQARGEPLIIPALYAVALLPAVVGLVLFDRWCRTVNRRRRVVAAPLAAG